MRNAPFTPGVGRALAKNPVTAATRGDRQRQQKRRMHPSLSSIKSPSHACQFGHNVSNAMVARGKRKAGQSTEPDRLCLCVQGYIAALAQPMVTLRIWISTSGLSELLSVRAFSML